MPQTACAWTGSWIELVVNLRTARALGIDVSPMLLARRRGNRTIPRREFIKLLGCGGAASWPLAARAQQGGMRRIGVLMGFAEGDVAGQAFVAAFREGLQKLGWMEGRNIRIDTRWATDLEARQRFAKELVALQPDLILAQSTPTTAALLQQTRTIPIVFAIVGDPVGSGFVASFPRPGGNVTGFTNFEPTMPSKWLELLKEVARARPGVPSLE